jgi:hypothetical protein
MDEQDGPRDLGEFSETDLIEGLPHQANAYRWEDDEGRGKKKKKRKSKRNSNTDDDDPNSIQRQHSLREMFPPVTRNFTIDHLVTLSATDRVKSIDYYAKKLSKLNAQGHIISKPIFLVITDTDIMVKDTQTMHEIFSLPLRGVMMCSHFNRSDSHRNVLILVTTDPVVKSKPQIHYFDCKRNPAPAITELINDGMKKAKRRASSKSPEHDNSLSPSRRAMTREMMDDDNWMLGSSHTSTHHHQPTMVQSPVGQGSVSQLSSSTDQLARGDVTNSPAMPELSHRMSPTIGQFFGGSPPAQHPSPSFNPPQHLRVQQVQAQEVSRSPRPPARMTTFIRNAANNYTNEVLQQNNSQSGMMNVEIKRTMKASKIQRDVDLLNHVIEDLESFMRKLFEVNAARKELEKIMKKTPKRKQNEAGIRKLTQKAQLPSDAEFVMTYQKIKYAINLVAKLGHHLLDPPADIMLEKVFVYLKEFMKKNQYIVYICAELIPQNLNKFTIVHYTCYQSINTQIHHLFCSKIKHSIMTDTMSTTCMDV